MPKRNKIKKVASEDGGFAAHIKKLSSGLYYMSETDAEINAFVGGKAEAVTAEEILRQTKSAADTPVEERNFAQVFERLTAMQDWFGDEEKQTAEKFGRLKDFLEANLRDLKIFKVGTIELKIYFVGLDGEGRLMGIQTEAVET